MRTTEKGQGDGSVSTGVYPVLGKKTQMKNLPPGQRGREEATRVRRTRRSPVQKKKVIRKLIIDGGKTGGTRAGQSTAGERSGALLLHNTNDGLGRKRKARYKSKIFLFVL